MIKYKNKLKVLLCFLPSFKKSVEDSIFIKHPIPNSTPIKKYAATMDH